MELLAQAKRLEQEFEQKKNTLRAQEVKQEMTKQQFIQAKEQLQQIGITFTTGNELQAIFNEKGQRLQELITQYEARKQQAAVAANTIPVNIPPTVTSVPNTVTPTVVSETPTTQVSAATPAPKLDTEMPALSNIDIDNFF